MRRIIILEPRLVAPLNPGLLSGFTPFAILLGLCLVGAAAGAKARDLPPQSERTVSWYVAHPAALEAATTLCREDPGRYRAEPDCINADAARMRVAEEEARRNAGNMAVPTSPNYWRTRPEERRQTLASCDRTRNPQGIFAQICAAARRT